MSLMTLPSPVVSTPHVWVEPMEVKRVHARDYIMSYTKGLCKVTNGTSVAGYREGGFPQIIATEG